MSAGPYSSALYDVGVRVDIWSDVVCPWCYIGKRRFERALAEFEGADDVDIVWRSFELDPDAPRLREGSSTANLAAKYGMTIERAEQAQANVTEIAAGVGLAYRLGETRQGNSFDAHRLLQLARRSGSQGALKERLMQAYFTEGAPIGDPDTLARLAAEAGLAAEEVAETLAGDAFAEDVRADELQAQRLGISGVPFFVIDGRLGVEGAQPETLLVEALRQARASTAA